jgi:hypothetical protein
MELQEALTQIAEIRRQMARTEVFRGYRAMPIAFSGLLALAAAGVQAVALPEPVDQPSAYLTLWVGAAAVSVLVAGAGMVWRCRRPASPLVRTMTWLAVEQFLPCLVAGALLTLVLATQVSDSLWMLPGLWALLFSLGVFASYRLLPQATFCVGLYYLAAGLGCLTLARGEAALSPWAMAVPFGGGQLLAAAVFYWTLERNHDEA